MERKAAAAAAVAAKGRTGWPSEVWCSEMKKNHQNHFGPEEQQQQQQQVVNKRNEYEKLKTNINISNNNSSYNLNFSSNTNKLSNNKYF